jgi:hypothetical protein
MVTIYKPDLIIQTTEPYIYHPQSGKLTGNNITYINTQWTARSMLKSAFC